MNYRLIIIDASLKNKSILRKYKMLSKTQFEAGTSLESPMYKIQIPEDDALQVSNVLKNNLISPYYAHLYHEDSKSNTLIVIFAGQLFNTSKNNPKDAIEYGVKHGVNKEQMDINPRNIAEEKW